MPRVTPSTHHYLGARRRGPEDVLGDHLRHLAHGEVEQDVDQNYAEDVVVLNATGVHRGHAGAKRAGRVLHKALGDAAFEFRPPLIEGELAFVEWVAHGPEAEVRDGADSYVIRQGRIVAQTSHYTVRPRH